MKIICDFDTSPFPSDRCELQIVDYRGDRLYSPTVQVTLWIDRAYALGILNDKNDNSRFNFADLGSASVLISKLINRGMQVPYNLRSRINMATYIDYHSNKKGKQA